MWSGLTGDLAGFSTLTDGSFYFVALPSPLLGPGAFINAGGSMVNPVAGAWFQSTFSPPRKYNRANPPPVISSALTFQPGFDPTLLTSIAVQNDTPDYRRLYLYNHVVGGIGLLLLGQYRCHVIPATSLTSLGHLRPDPLLPRRWAQP